MSSLERIIDANSVLIQQLSEIHTISKWARLVGFTDAVRFSREYRNYFGVSPKKAMVEIRLKTAISLLKSKPCMSCYEIARAIGKKDEKSLNFYFSVHIGKPPTAFRTKDKE